jgi:hypothetical protein
MQTDQRSGVPIASVSTWPALSSRAFAVMLNNLAEARRSLQAVGGLLGSQFAARNGSASAPTPDPAGAALMSRPAPSTCSGSCATRPVPPVHFERCSQCGLTGSTPDDVSFMSLGGSMDNDAVWAVRIDIADLQSGSFDMHESRCGMSNCGCSAQTGSVARANQQYIGGQHWLWSLLMSCAPGRLPAQYI